MNSGVFTGKGIPLRGNDIDTDRIIPARYLKCVTFTGLGASVFIDERSVDDDHPFNDSRWISHSVLVVNANFGCGSSREHAPQALKDYGIRALVGESFSEIFAGNCLSLGMPALTLKETRTLQTVLERDAQTELVIDLKSMEVRAGERVWAAEMDDAHRLALLDGSWDSVAVLAEADTTEVASNLPYMTWAKR